MAKQAEKPSSDKSSAPTSKSPPSRKADSADVMKKLEGLGLDMLVEIDHEQTPSFSTTLRSKSNVLFDEAVGCLRLGEKTEQRKFVNVGQARKFMQTVAIANKCKKFLREDALRDLS